MSNQTSALPTPDTLSKEHTEKVEAHIKTRILNSEKKKLSFSEFMQEALYAPGLGYYAAGNKKFGPEGDFITAPEISSLFGQCLANQCADILSEVKNGAILEFGAGTGK